MKRNHSFTIIAALTSLVCMVVGILIPLLVPTPEQKPTGPTPKQVQIWDEHPSDAEMIARFKKDRARYRRIQAYVTDKDKNPEHAADINKHIFWTEYGVLIPASVITSPPNAKNGIVPVQDAHYFVRSEKGFAYINNAKKWPIVESLDEQDTDETGLLKIEDNWYVYNRPLETKINGLNRTIPSSR